MTNCPSVYDERSACGSHHRFAPKNCIHVIDLQGWSQPRPFQLHLSLTAFPLISFQPHDLSSYLLPAAQPLLFTLILSLTVPHSPSSLFRTWHGEGAGVFAATPVQALSGRARPWWAAVAQAEAQKAGAHLGALRCGSQSTKV